MSNYKSNDNSTENTTLREWWGTVKSEMSRIFGILNGLETIVSITKNEVDDCTDVGLYHVVNGEDEIGGSEYYVFTSKHSGTLGMPEVRQIKINDKVYVRTKKSTEEWSEWTEIGAVGEFTSDEGIIFNKKSKALSPNAVAMGPNCTAGGKGFKVLLQEEISGSGSITEKHTFNGGTQSIDITIKEGETQHIFKSSVSTLGGTGGLAFYDNIRYEMVYVNTFPTVVDVTDAKFANGYTIYSDNSNTEEDITFELERVSGSTSKTYDFPYFQHEGAGFGTCFVSTDILKELEVGMKCTLTVGGVTATGVVVDSLNYDSISITFSAVPWDFPNHSGGTFTVGEEAPPKIVYTLDSVDGIEVGMAYSLVNPSGKSTYNAGTIKEIAEDKVTIDDDGSINAQGCFMAIIGHPELGTQDIGTNSFAVGNGTVALSENQVAKGKFNVEDNANQYADIVGNGKSGTDRSNAYTLDWDGNGTFAGDVKVKGEISVSSIFGMKPKMERIKRYVGETIPTGEVVKLVELVAPFTAYAIYNSLNSSYVGIGDVPEWNKGMTIDTIEDPGEGTSCSERREDCYAVFEVPSGTEKEPCLCLTSPDGSKFALSVDNNGDLSTSKIV